VVPWKRRLATSCLSFEESSKRSGFN